MLSGGWDYLGPGCFRRRPAKVDDRWSTISGHRSRFEVSFETEPSKHSKDRERPGEEE